MDTLLHVKILLVEEVDSLKISSLDQKYVSTAEHIINGEAFQLVQQFINRFEGKVNIKGEISTSSVLAALNDFLKLA